MIGHSLAVVACRPDSDINLSGTLVSPNPSYDYQVTPTTAEARWYFRSDGSVDHVILGSTIEFNPTPDEWFNPNGAPGATYYIRATVVSGDAPNVGSAVGSVLALSSDQSWGWQQTGSIGSRSGVILVEIFSDSGGTNLLASGYYSGAATMDIAL